MICVADAMMAVSLLRLETFRHKEKFVTTKLSFSYLLYELIMNTYIVGGCLGK